MRLVSKSIIRKLFLNLFLFALLISVVVFYFYYTGEELVPFYILILALGVFLIYFLVVYWVDIVRPLRSILTEMQCLIAGKPYRQIYTTRIDEIGIIGHFFNQVTKGLGQVSQDIKEHDRMLTELTIAAQLQRDILPLKSPKIQGLQIVAKNKPASELGGDSFNFIQVKDKIYVYIGDVTGHGVAAGLIMTMANSLINVFSEIYDSPYEIIVKVNSHIKNYVKSSMFMTMVMLCWDIKNEQLSYIGAGHEHILLYHSASGECEAIISGGVALGMVPDNSKMVKEQKIKFENGDFVLLYSDGITEAKNTSGEMFGLERLKNSFMEHANQYSAEGVNYHVAKDVSAFMAGHIQEDDMSLIVIKRDKTFAAQAADKELSTNWQD